MRRVFLLVVPSRGCRTEHRPHLGGNFERFFLAANIKDLKYYSWVLFKDVQLPPELCADLYKFHEYFRRLVDESGKPVCCCALVLTVIADIISNRLKQTNVGEL